MILKTMAMTFALFGMQALAATDRTPIDGESFCGRLQIMEEALVFDQTGTKIIHSHREDRRPSSEATSGEKEKKSDEVVCRRGSSSGYSSSAFTGTVFFHHEWSIKRRHAVCNL